MGQNRESWFAALLRGALLWSIRGAGPFTDIRIWARQILYLRARYSRERLRKLNVVVSATIKL